MCNLIASAPQFPINVLNLLVLTRAVKKSNHRKGIPESGIPKRAFVKKSYKHSLTLTPYPPLLLLLLLLLLFSAHISFRCLHDLNAWNKLPCSMFRRTSSAKDVRAVEGESPFWNSNCLLERSLLATTNWYNCSLMKSFIEKGGQGGHNLPLAVPRSPASRTFLVLWLPTSAFYCVFSVVM